MQIRKGISIMLGSLIGAACIQLIYVACNNVHVDSPDANAQSTDLTALTARVTALEGQITSLQTRPTVGKYCGASALGTTGAIGTSANKDGYLKAALACRQVASCGANARMCTTMEMVYSLQVNAIPPSGVMWVSSGLGFSSNTTPNDDCSGWTAMIAGRAGPAWNADIQQPIQSNCATSQPIACCN